MSQTPAVKFKKIFVKIYVERVEIMSAITIVGKRLTRLKSNNNVI